MLTDYQIERYSRQIILPQVGGKGQEKLLHARVLVHGSGLIESTALFYLAAAGIGTLGIFTEGAFPLFAAFVAQDEHTVSRALNRLNPDCHVVLHPDQDTRDPEQVIQSYDVVLSSVDTLHDPCYASRCPFVYARFTPPCGVLFVGKGYEPDQPCLRCSAARLLAGGRCNPTANIPAAMFFGSLQATETLKLILGLGQSSAPHYVRCEFPGLRFSQPQVKKDPRCVLCGPGLKLR